MPLYTKTGDTGETGLFDGSRVSKSEPRVAAYGDIDELNAVIGLAIACGVGDEVVTVLDAVQRDLFTLGAQLADPRERGSNRGRKTAVAQADVERLESAIDRFEAQLPPLKRFILPGGDTGGAALHVARAVCRRAERAIVSLGPDNLSSELLRYVNRLSDLLFVLARVVSHRHAVPEREW